MDTEHTTATSSSGAPTGPDDPENSSARAGAGKTSARPPSPEAARRLLAVAEELAATGGRAGDETSEADLSRLLRGIAPAEAALDRAALMALGAARGRGWSWPRIGTALGMTADGARDRFDRAAARHPDYRAPLAPTLAAHTAHAGDLIDAITDPPRGFTRHAAARLLGAVLLAATLDRTPELVGHWLTDPALSGAAAAVARHPKAAQAHKALADFVRERPGTRADLLDIIREAVRSTPWALDAAKHANAAGDGRLRLHPGGGLFAPAAVPVAPVVLDTDPDHSPASPSTGSTRHLLDALNTPEQRALSADAAQAGQNEDPGPAAPAAPAPGSAEATVAAARWPRATAGPVADLVAAVRLVALHLPADRTLPVCALVQAVDAGDGEAMARAVGILRDLDEAERADLLGDDGLRALDALPGVLPGLHPVPRGVPVRSDAGDRVGNLSDLGEAIRLRVPDLAPGAAADALRALVHAIDTGAPKLLEEPMAAVAELDEAERSRALGVPGTRMWERALLHWGPPTPRPELVAAAGLPTEVAQPLALLCDGGHLDALIHSGVGYPVGEALGSVVDAYRAQDAAALDWAVGRLTALDGAALAERIRTRRIAQAWQDLHRAATDRKAKGAAPGATPDGGAQTESTGYGPALHGAGLTRAAAAALTTPLTVFAVAAERAGHLQREGVLRQALLAVTPALRSGDPERLGVLLHAVPHLNAIGLEEWVLLYGAVQDHAQHLEAPTNVPALLADAGLTGELAQPLRELMPAARVGLLAATAPGHPPVAAAAAWSTLFAALDAALADDLPEALDQVAALERMDLPADNPGALTLSWERLAALWQRVRANASDGQDQALAESAPADAPPARYWEEQAAAVTPEQPELAAAVARLLAVATSLVGGQKLGKGKTHEALYQLSTVVQAGNRSTIGKALEGVLALDPSRAPLTKHPRLADALRALISVYDNQ